MIFEENSINSYVKSILHHKVQSNHLGDEQDDSIEFADSDTFMRYILIPYWGQCLKQFRRNSIYLDVFECIKFASQVHGVYIEELISCN